MKQVDDLRIEREEELVTPAVLQERYPVSDAASETVSAARAGLDYNLHQLI